jgi:hypothetical protein
MTGFTQAAYCLDPSEDFSNPFALALTHRVPRMVRGALINDTGGLAREMRGDSLQLPVGTNHDE